MRWPRAAVLGFHDRGDPDGARREDDSTRTSGPPPRAETVVMTRVAPVGDGRLQGGEPLVAELERERRRYGFLAQVGAALLAASLDYEGTLARTAALAVPELADLCLVDVVGTDGSVRRLAVAHAEGAAALAAQLRERPPPRPGSHPLLDVLASGQPALMAVVPDSLLVAIAAEGKELSQLRRWVRSYMCVPLVAGGRTLGAISFAAGTPGRFGDEDLLLAEELARRAALALENARLYALQRDIAHTLQQSLLPARLPEIPGLEIAARYLPGGEGHEVGGDFYDLFRIGREWAVVIGDVCGRGPRAAALTALARHTIRADAAYEPTPRRVLGQLNQAVLHQQREPQLMTVAYLRLRVGRRRVDGVLASGGHPPPLILRSDGRVETIACRGTLIGAFAEIALSERSLRLRSGDALLLYTDGLTEARRAGTFFGPERLEALLGGCAGLGAAAIIERLERGLADFLGAPAQDDVALLVLRAFR
jgi:serine phosphatase RsbU (regulator of sigma subunit)